MSGPCAWLAALLAGLCYSAGGLLAAGLHPVPEPDLSGFEPGVREVLSQAADRVRGRATVADGPESGNDFGRLGMLYQAHELRMPAAQCYENAIILQPGEPRWRYYRAFLHEEGGDVETALAGYRRVFELDPAYLPAAVRAGRMYLQLGDHETAASWFQKVLEQEPDNAAAQAGLGQAEVQLKRYAQAITHLEAALAAEPEASQLRFPLALAYRQSGQADEAREQLALRGKGQVSLDDLWLGEMHALSLSSDYYLRAALYEMNRGDAAAAAQRAAYAVRLNPENADARVLLAGILDALGREDEAMDQVDAALALAADNWQANYNKAALLEKRGEEAAARDYYRRSLDAKPDEARSRRLLANSLMRAGEFAAAAEEYRLLREQRPEESQLYFWEGLALIGAGECAAAREVLKQGWDANPSSPVLAQAVLRVFATCARPDAPTLAEALKVADRLAVQQPTISHVETLAMVVAATARYEDAVDIQTQAIFEALKSETMDRYPGLSPNVQRYQNQLPAEHPWQPDDPIFAPPRLGAAPEAGAAPAEPARETGDD